MEYTTTGIWEESPVLPFSVKHQATEFTQVSFSYIHSTVLKLCNWDQIFFFIFWIRQIFISI